MLIAKFIKSGVVTKGTSSWIHPCFVKVMQLKIAPDHLLLRNVKKLQYAPEPVDAEDWLTKYIEELMNYYELTTLANMQDGWTFFVNLTVPFYGNLVNSTRLTYQPDQMCFFAKNLTFFISLLNVWSRTKQYQDKTSSRKGANLKTRSSFSNGKENIWRSHLLQNV
jgi:hypothetical protein